MLLASFCGLLAFIFVPGVHADVTRNARIDAITPQVLQDVFKRYFPADRSTVVTLVPAATAQP